MSKRSQSLADKLATRLAPDPDVIHLSHMLTASRSMNRFDSPAEFQAYLGEGALLNVSVIGSKALSVPCGEYLVWMTDAGHTMLVPTAGPKSREVFEHGRDQYEVLTRDLMANWNKLEKTIAEDGGFQQNLQQGGNEENLEEPEEGDAEQGQAGEFTSQIDASTVDRTPIMRAMQDRGHTVTSLAQAVGVDPPAISRILRTPKDTQGDPGGRNPSMGLASQICNALRLDPTAAFPDIFSAKNYEARQNPGNVGSGDHGHGKGGGAWDKGSVQESLQESIDILEATEDYETLVEEIAASGLPFDCFWREAFWPSVRRIRRGSGLVEFVGHLRNAWGQRQQSVDEGIFRNPAAPPKAAPPVTVTCPSCEKRFRVRGDSVGKKVTCPYCKYAAAYNESGAAIENKPAAPKVGTPTPKAPVSKPSAVKPPARPGVKPPADATAIDATAPMEPATPPAEPPVEASSDKLTQKIMPGIYKAFEHAMNTLKQDLQQVQIQSGSNPKIAPHAWEVVNQFYKTVMQAGKGYQPKWKKTPKASPPEYRQQFNKAQSEFMKSYSGGDKNADPLAVNAVDTGGTAPPTPSAGSI